MNLRSRLEQLELTHTTKQTANDRTAWENLARLSGREPTPCPPDFTWNYERALIRLRNLGLLPGSMESTAESDPANANSAATDGAEISSQQGKVSAMAATASIVPGVTPRNIT